MRLGELLVRSGLLAPRQVELALRAQVMWGGRLGTNVVELFGLDLDALSKLVARQHALPPAFAQHFEAADPDLQRQLAPELAAQYTCVPLRRLAGERVVLASIAPLDGRARALVADQLGISYKGLVPAIAAELRVHYHLERVYQIPREARFLRSRTVSQVFEGDLEVDHTPSIDDAIPEEVLPEFTPRVEMPEPPLVDRRHYLVGKAIGRIALVPRRPEVPRTTASLAEALGALRQAADRDAIAARAVEAAETLTGGRAMLLVVRGEAAASHRGDLTIPLDQPSAVASVLGHAGGASTIDAALLKELGTPAGELAVAPIGLAGQVWSVIVVGVERGRPTAGLTEIAAAAAIAFARLLRHANR